MKSLKIETLFNKHQATYLLVRFYGASAVIRTMFEQLSESSPVMMENQRQIRA